MNNPDYIGTATFSPEDNKLRLYPFARLSKELYDRVKAAGFGWAPKQELFVAPMWTPGRFDLLEELCGEVGDEDKSLVERSEERADRFEDYSDKRGADAERARKGVAVIADNIPLGQPILVGHHSEKHARKDAERIENGMRRAVKMWATSEYWTRRAAGAVHAAKYKERPDVRARRIKGIEADRRKQERSKAEHEHALKFWRGECVFVNRTTGEKKPCAITEENREFIADILGKTSSLSYLQLPRKEGDRPDWDQRCGAWEGLANHYPNLYARRTVAECQAAALSVYPASIARADRWLAHYDNRLAYERAMLADAGGMVTDRTGPEIGGAVRSIWAPRGGWAYIVKVNRVTLTIRHQWNAGGRVFDKNLPFDKVPDIMSKAQVEAARASGRLLEVPDLGFLLGPERPNTDKPEDPTEGRTIWNSDGTDGPALICCPPDSKPKAEDFAAMKETLRAGVKVVVANQLFPTPHDIAHRMADLADLRPGQRVLEPSAGTGAILNGITVSPLEIVAVEINTTLADRLRETQGKTVEVRCCDFLTCNGDLGKFDRILMNPPFQNGIDIVHIRKALTFLKPGGKLVAICAGGSRQEAALQPIADSWEQLPDDAFKEQGTGVRTVLATFTKE